VEGNSCQEKLRYAERAWGELKQRLEQCEATLEKAEKELNKLTRANQEYQACCSNLEKTHELIAQLEKEKGELLKFKRYIRHPDVWIENATDPLAKALRAADATLKSKPLAAPTDGSIDPTNIVRTWAHKLYELTSSNINQSARKEIEIYLVALWYWVRFEEIVARFEVEE